MATPSHRTSLTPSVLLVLGGLTLFGPIGTDAFLPALPTIAEDLGTTASGVQLALTGFTVGMGAGQLLAGPISDAVGRRRPMLIGTAGLALAALVAAASPTATALIVASAAMGLFAAVGLVVSRASVADLVQGPPLTRAYALLGTLTGIGPVLGPLVGVALMLLLGWRGIYLGLGVAAVGCLLAALLVLPESRPPHQRVRGGMRALGRNLATVVRSRAFLAGAALIWLTFAALFAYISASSFVVQNVLGFSAVGYTVVFSVNGVGMVVAATVTARLSGRVSRRAFIAVGVAMQTGGAVLVVCSAVQEQPSAWLLLPGMLLIASSMGFVFGPCSAMALEGVRHASGTALALIGAVQFLVAGTIAPLVGIAGERAVLPLGVAVALCALAAWPVWAFLLPRSPADGT